MDLFKKIETAANVAVIVLVALFGWTVFRGNPRSTSAASPVGQPAGPKIGLNLNQTLLKDVSWAANQNTLVLGLQTTCHFCTESGPFFQKLTVAAAGSTKIVAVLPQTVEESKQYLSKLGVHVDEVRSAPLSSIGVSGTPTMMLVDNKGIVRKVWLGKLPEEQQSQVPSAVVPARGSHPGGL